MKNDDSHARGGFSFPALSRVDAAAPGESSPRQASMASRTATHESAHCAIARLFDFPISSATIVPDAHFGGLVRSKDDSEPVTPSTMIENARELCDEALGLAPPPGEDRGCIAPWSEYTRCRNIELLAGREAELLAGYDDIGGGATDIRVARLYAQSMCLSPAAVDAFLAYATVEAKALLKRYWHCVEAIAAALDEHKTLTGEQIDRIIFDAEAGRAHESELRRRERNAEATARAVMAATGNES